nr:MAG TPA: hypothetical protein [Caudoviricetes sp.]
MSTIRIFSKKAFAFGPGAIQGSDVIENFVTVPGTFQDMPDKYQDDFTFKMAVKYKEVEIVQHEVQVPVTPKVEEIKTEAESDSDDSVEKFYEELKIKNKDEVKELAEKYGAEFVDSDPLKINKKRVMEAYKLSVSKE